MTTAISGSTLAVQHVSYQPYDAESRRTLCSLPLVKSAVIPVLSKCDGQSDFLALRRTATCTLFGSSRCLWSRALDYQIHAQTTRMVIPESIQFPQHPCSSHSDVHSRECMVPAASMPKPFHFHVRAHSIAKSTSESKQRLRSSASDCHVPEPKQRSLPNA